MHASHLRFSSPAPQVQSLHLPPELARARALFASSELLLTMRRAFLE